MDDSSYDGKLLRLKQEYFYSASAIRDIFKRYKNRYGSIDKIDERIKIFANDIHPTIALVEFIRILNETYKLSIREAIDISRRVFEHIAFSITDDSLEAYPVDMVKRVNPEIIETILQIQDELWIENHENQLIRNGYVLFKNINMTLSNEYIFLSKTLKEEKPAPRKLSYMNLGTDRVLYLEKSNESLMKVFTEYGIRNSSVGEILKIKNLKTKSSFIDDLEDVKFANKKKLIALTKRRLTHILYLMFNYL